MSQELRIAVTGVGGGCGQAIVRALRMAKSFFPVIYPIDVTPTAVGLYMGNRAGAVLPKPEEDLSAWEGYLKQHHIQALFCGSDHDLEPLAAVKDDWAHFCTILTHPMNVAKLSNDKALTYQLMKQMELWSPASVYDVDETRLLLFAARVGFPLVVKPRFGMTSRGVQVVQDEEELLFHWKRTKKPIVQRLIDGDEYTSALFFDENSRLKAHFTMRRWLYAGSTYRAETIENHRFSGFFEHFARKWVEKTPYRPVGALNIQFRTEDLTPYVLEINARCSGSTSMRAYFGYNEPEMWVRQGVYGEEIEQPDTTEGVAMRYWQEWFLDDVKIETLNGEVVL